MVTMLSEKARLAGLQGVIIAAAAAVANKYAAPIGIWSVAFGGGVAIFATLFLVWRHAAGAGTVEQGAERVLRQAYRTSLERFVLVACLLAIGMGILKLAPAWVLAGFVSGQAAWLAAPLWFKKSKN